VDGKHRALKYVPVASGALLVLIVVIAAIWLIRNFMANKEQKAQRVVQNITVIRPPPPPPPDEPPPPPPPEKIEQQVPQDKPDPSHDEAPPPAANLGLDAEGAAGSDAFGLEGRPGGSDLVGGNGGAVFAWYTNKLKDTIIERLSADPRLHGKKYNVPLRIWLEADGRIRNMQLINSTGDKEIDNAIAADVSSIGRFTEAPPLELPQPITWQLNSHT
jgi:periplasmic protein TonB